MFSMSLKQATAFHARDINRVGSCIGFGMKLSIGDELKSLFCDENKMERGCF